MPHLKVTWDRGIVVRLGDTVVCLDPQSPRIPYQHVFVSHAHSDHTAGFAAEGSVKYSTQATAEMFEASTGRKIVNSRRLSFREKIKVEDFEVTAYNSGHILGSTVFRMDTPEGTVIYTGDINCVDTLVTSAATPLDCDILIIESTYGDSQFIFPKRDEIYTRMVKWVIEKVSGNRIPVFYVFPTGKAQEIVRMLNEFTEVDVHVHPIIAKINRVYTGLNVKLEATSHSPSSESSKCTIVYPHYAYGSTNVANEASASATGWALKYSRNRDIFPLSSHADFPQLLQFIRYSKPKTVFTSFGSSRSLANHIKHKLEINAHSLH